MKLLTKSTYYFLVYSGIAMIAGGILLYLTVRKQVYKQIDSTLETEKTIIQDQIEQTGLIPDFAASFGHQIEVRMYNTPIPPVQSFFDSLLVDTASGTSSPYRCFYFASNLSGNKGYTINIIQSLVEKKMLLESIGLYMFLLFLSLLIISIFLNYFISKKLWRPFQETVEKAEKFDIQSDKLLNLPETNINEFRHLNSVISRMTKKMREDYLGLKEYHENAAHEIQTPLAVIRSKMELLMQKRELRKESLNLIRSINESTTRLLKLNQGLLLISKIENSFYREEKEVSLRQLIENNLSNYKEILELKRITTQLEADSPAVVIMNEVLAEVLISNLLSNAVRYNVDGGFINCSLKKGSLIISNSGLPLKTDPELLFRRFHKTSDNPQSVGLGLSIVRKITETYNMELTYTCTGNIHHIKMIYSGISSLNRSA